MKRSTATVLALPCVLGSAPFAFADGFTVVPSAFDPAGTHLVATEWVRGIGCPSNASTSSDGVHLDGHYTDPACSSGDSSDTHVEGLLLAKTGPTSNYAAGQASLVGVAGKRLMELGYDIRKPGPTNTTGGVPTPGTFTDPRGSHCGAGAPRFDVVIGGMDYFVGCSSTATLPTMSPAGQGWERLRWGTAGTLLAQGPSGPTDIEGMTVNSIDIIFDEGDDTGPDNFGLAVLDNIDFNTTLVGRGPQQNNDEDEAQGEDGKGDAFHSDDSPSRPESSSMSYEDQSKGMKVQSVNGARSITYSGTCVSYAGDALVNTNPGYVFTFEACNLSALGTGIGNFAIAVTGPAGFLYQNSAVLTSGYVSIHAH